MGGSPDLPPGTKWPTWLTPNGDVRPLRFFAQVDLASASLASPGPLDLPDTGLLSFFVDFTSGFDDDHAGITGQYSWELDGSRVLYSDRVALARTSGPLAPLPCAAWHAYGAWSWCEPFDFFVMAESGVVPNEELTIVEALLDAHVRAQQVQVPEGFTRSGMHRLGGFPDPIQDLVESDVERAAAGYGGEGDNSFVSRLEDEVGQWRLLLQLDSEATLQLSWGDGGSLYWMARIDDIAARRWRQGRLAFQCS